jgi:hypothetical protein
VCRRADDLSVGSRTGGATTCVVLAGESAGVGGLLCGTAFKDGLNRVLPAGLPQHHPDAGAVDTVSTMRHVMS